MDDKTTFAPRERLDGHVAAVTGGTGAIGLAIARRLAGRGSRCVLLHRGDALAAAALAAALPGSAHRALLASITDSPALHASAAAVQRDFGRCDILVNSAGCTLPVAPADLGALSDGG